MSDDVLILGGITYHCIPVTKKERVNKRESKRRAVAYKGGKCEDCERVYPDCVYDFHHKDPTQKDD